MKKFFICAIVLLSSIAAKGQGWSDDDEISNRQVGLRLGTGMYSVFGGELKNPRPKTGFQAGLFWYGNRERKRFNWQTGLEVCLMGSNFKNEDSFGLSSASNYTQMGIIQVDVPLLINLRVQPYSEKKYSAVQFGLVPGGIINSVIYTGEDKVPLQQNNLKPWKNLPLNLFNLQGCLGYQYRGGAAGFNVRIKASLLNLNDNFVLPDLQPATGNNKFIGTWALEFGMIF